MLVDGWQLGLGGKRVNEFIYGVHWLSVVVTGPKENAFMLYDLFFKDLFGELQSMGHGGRGFDQIWHSLLEFKVYISPRHGGIEYFNIEIPGQACELISWQLFQGLDDVLRSNYPNDYHYTRLDFSFDELSFSPQDAEDAISNNQVRSLAKRETLIVHKSPFEKRDNGEIGTHTIEFGSRFSERMIRIYNRRGFTRLEIELKKNRADLIAKQIFSAQDVSEWWPIMISHLRDYIDFKTDWWDEFINGVGRARAIVSSPKEMSAERITRWLEKQVAPSLSAIHDMRPDYFLKDLIMQGRIKRGTRFDLLLADTQPKLDFYDELGRRVWANAEKENEKEEGKNE